MSLYDDFLKLYTNQSNSTTNGKNTNSTNSTGKKKKNSSLLEEFLSLQAEDNIAPVSDRITNRVTVSDFAPTKEKERTWFQKGKYLDDGYDFGDITKTILGTTADVVENLGTGIIGMGEKAVDALATLAPILANSGLDRNAMYIDQEYMDEYKKSQKALEKEVSGFVAKDLYNEENIAKKIMGGLTFGTDYEAMSVLGEKSDSVIQSGGQLLGTMGLQAVGVPWFLTTGATAFGGESENALNQGATYEEAAYSGAIAAGAEILTEKLSGGIKFGGKALDDALTAQLARGISNKFVRNAAKLGLDALGEGAEEWITEDINKFGQWLTYRDEEELKELLFSEEAMNEKIEAFLGGAALGGVSNVGNAVKSSVKGIDYASGLTKNEEMVVRKVYNDLVAEAQKNGKVTEKQKAKIYDEVLEQMEKGYISVDTIEEVLGGESYNSYKSTVAYEDNLLKEFEDIGKKPNPTASELHRYNELFQQVNDLKANDQRGQLKSKLSDEVLGIVKGDRKGNGSRLIESYNEKARRSQAFEADLTQYNAKQRATIQKAIDAGILNNTNRTHEFVDIIAKISADKGVPFDFANNAKIKESGFAVDGQVVDGYITKDGITINVDSHKAWQSTVGHEITHVLEGTEFYDSLKQTLFDYAKSKGEYQSRYDSIVKRYKEGTDYEAELTADLVGDYLFQDKEFVTRLSAENRNVFQKIYDEIKYLYKVATAGSKEARELEKVKKVFEDAYRANVKGKDGTQHSLSEDADSVLDDDVLIDDLELELELFLDDPDFDWDEILGTKWVSNLESNNTEVAPAKDETVPAQSKELLPSSADEIKQMYSDAIDRGDISKAQRIVDEVARLAGYTQKAYHGTDEHFNEFSEDKISAANVWGKGFYFGTVKSIAEDYAGREGRVVPTYLKMENPFIPRESSLGTAQEIKDKWFPDMWNDFPQLGIGYIEGKLQNDPHDLLQFIASKNGIEIRDVLSSYGYDSVKSHGELVVFSPTQIKSSDAVTFDDNGNWIPVTERFNKENPDIRYSLSDTEGTQVSPAVAKRFGNSKAVDENGNLKVLYHGTASGEFSIFDKTKGSVEGDFGSGFYFTDDAYDVENNYEGGGPDFENKVGRRADEIWGEEDIEYGEAEKRAREELYKGSHLFKVYLNIENPAVVGETILLDPDSYYSQFDQEDYDSEDDYLAEVEQLIADEIDNIIWEVERNVDVDSTDGIADVLWGAFNEGGVDPELLKKRLNSLYLEDSNGNLVANEVARQIIESLGYDGIIDNTVSSKWNMQMNPGTTHYIVFKPNQIKAVTNQNPTDNPDIHRSLSDMGEAPTRYGNFATPAKDLRLETAPVAEKVQPAEEKATPDYVQDQLNGIHSIGKLVRASDRGNYGYIEDYDDATDRYTVRFTSETGSSAAVEFGVDEIEPITTVKDMFPNEPDIDQYDYENATAVIEAAESRLSELAEMDLENPDLAAEYQKVFDAWVEAKTIELELGTKMSEQFDSLSDADAPPEKVFDAPVKSEPKVAEVLKNPSKKPKRGGMFQRFLTSWVDKGSAIEKLSLDTGNMELQAKWNSALPSYTDGKAQNFMKNGAKNVPALKSVLKEQKKSGKTNLFDLYMYHLRNIDSMTLQERMNLANIPVFGKTVTAEVSRAKVAQLEKQNPEFKRWSKAYYANSNYMLDLLVKEGVVSQESADYFRNKYPHYVPIVRDGKVDPNFTQDTSKLGVGDPIKTATGGNGEMEPLANAMAQRIQQTFRAVGRNRFGIELRNTLGSTKTEGKNLTNVENLFGSYEDYENGLLKPGSFESRPTFSVFEGGNRFEFEISEDLYGALKPTSEGLAYRNAVLTGASEFRRKLLTVWNPVFVLYRNPLKDLQDVAVNSQHPARTYANVPNSAIQLLFNGKMAQEYRANGGGANTYYDGKSNQFKFEDNVFKKVFGIPFRGIEAAGEYIEQIPRLAEYIASRNEGRSIDRSMLDAARVTTNFAAGGDFTRFLNSHGCTFLNASVQGAAQHVRNFREATKLDGLKGLTKTLAKYVVAGVPTVIFNSLVWGDDEEYEELNDYVKQNYYVIVKTDEGKFFRLPKGRTASVMGEIFTQMENLVTGDDEADFSTFFDLFMENIAPNNPLSDNMYAPIFQAASNNAWYSEDIVPSRLQDLPAEEQFDESTDSLSKWLGEKVGWSPMKINYLLDQYSGGIGDVVLPMMTPEAESGDDSFVGNLLAPWKKEMTTDKELNNKNPGLFFDLSDKLEALSNSKDATQEDEMKAMYIQTVGWEISDLYAQKRDIQNSNYSDAVKYEKVRDLQEQINDLAKKAMESYEDVSVDGFYATVGDKRFEYSDYNGKWYEISGKYLEKEQAAIERYDITPAEYWNNTDLFYEADYFFNYKPDMIDVANLVYGGKEFAPYAAELGDIKADTDEKGNYISGSKKDKVIDYINNQGSLDYGEKIVMFKMNYPADDTYNNDIIDYLNERDDISYTEMESILKSLGFKVDSKGNISW